MTQTLKPVHIGTYQPGTKEWEDLRRFKLGGSEISAVLGLSPYESRFSLWWRKKGLAQPKQSSPHMEWGNRLEGAILARFAEDHPDYQLGSCGSYTHPERPWMLASPDGRHYSGVGIVEAKTAQADLEWGEPPDGEIPIGYRCQAIWNMAVLGANHCWIPVLIRGYDYREYAIVWDDGVAADAEILIAAGEQFIQDLINDHEPDIDGSDATYQVIRERHPDIEPGDIEIDEALKQAFLEASVARREIGEIWKLAASEILQTMGKARNAVDADGNQFAYRRQPPNGNGSPYLHPNERIIRAMRPTRTITTTKEIPTA